VTFEELEEKYPNGFYDANITSLNLDYKNRTAKLCLSLRGNAPDGPGRDEYKRAVLTVNGFYYFVIEPPDNDHLWYPQRPIQVTGHPEDVSLFPLSEHVKEKLSPDAFCCRFYVHDWNSFIHIAARNAELTWLADDLQANRRTSAINP
jgi:hypothetical protein